MPITSRITDGNVDLTRVGRYVRSISVSESVGTQVVQVDIKDGSSGGTVIDSVRCPGGQSFHKVYPDPGLKCASGVFIAKAGSGTLNGSVLTS